MLLLVLAPLTQVLVPEVAAALPNGAGLALAQAHYGRAYLGPLPGGLILTAETAVTSALAAWRLRRSDVA